MVTPSPIAGPEGRVVDAGRGWAWWTEAWQLFTRQALMWLALALILIVGMGVVGLVPVLGGLATALVTPAFIASWMLAVRKVQGGGMLEVADLFTCFKGERLTPLLVVGAVLIGAVLVIGVVAGVLGVGAVIGMAVGGARENVGGMMAAAGAGLLALLVVLVVAMVVSLVLWFAPGLVVFRQMAPIDALRTSALAVLKNWLPCLVYGLVYIAAAIVASIPFGLGWLVLIPLTLISIATSYQDVFGDGTST